MSSSATAVMRRCADSPDGRGRMSILEEVLSFAFGTYNADSTLRASAFEYGHVLYRSPANTLLTSERVVSPDANSVSLYDAEATLRALGFDEKFEGAYLGDHHVHPAGVSWMSQLPSPADVTSVSVANDLWPNELGELCYVAPKIRDRAEPALRGRLRPDAHARSGALCFACGAGGGACGRRKSIRRGTLGQEQSPRPTP